MTVVVTIPPAGFVGLDAALAHLRVEPGDDDIYIGALLRAAQAHLEGPGGWLGRAIGVQTLEWRGHPCDGSIYLPYPPFVSLVSVKYGPAGAEQEIELDELDVEPQRFRAAEIMPKSGMWPTSTPIRVRYTAGYAPGAAEATPIQQAILLMVGHWYRNREAVVEGQMSAMPMAVDALLAPLRVWSI